MKSLNNLNEQQSWYLGIGLIVFAVLLFFNLWWLVPIVLTAGLAIFVYTQQRQEGNIGRAVQGGLWLMGLALLLLLKSFVQVPAIAMILLLAGASLLLRGREDKVDATVQQALRGFRKRESSQAGATSVPITSADPNGTPQSPEPSGAAYGEPPNTGPTTRL
jgi:hypothetical protein